MANIMESLGFIHLNNNTDIEAVQDIWRHLQPVEGAEPSQ